MLAVRQELYPVVVVALRRELLWLKGNLKHVINQSISSRNWHWSVLQRYWEKWSGDVKKRQNFVWFPWKPVVAWHQCMTEFSILNCVMLIIVIIIIILIIITNNINNNHIIFITYIIIFVTGWWSLIIMFGIEVTDLAWSLMVLYHTRIHEREKENIK